MHASQAAVMEIYQHNEHKAGLVPSYPLPYPLCDGAKFSDVSHCDGTQYMYTATLHQPEGVPLECVEGEGGADGLLAEEASGAVSLGGHDMEEEEEDAEQEALSGGRAVVVKYTAHVGYGEAAHTALAQLGLAPALLSCTRLPGRMVEVGRSLGSAAGWLGAHALAASRPRQHGMHCCTVCLGCVWAACKRASPDCLLAPRIACHPHSQCAPSCIRW